VDYYRGSIPLLSDIQVNIAFLRSLGELAKTFQQFIGTRTHTIKPEALFAEIIAFDTSQPKEVVEYHPVFRENFSKFKSPHRSCKTPSSHSNAHPYKKEYGNGTFCNYCKRKAHEIEGCFKKRWCDEQREEGYKVKDTNEPDRP
jgi:hypothetical protein